uniref:Uncharacterized protein n=1 Tax=Cacopsylla melanoneura TaxID=428564 RepID=A0A8D8RH20_9HEMI
MFLASLVQQSSSRTVPNKLPDKMKLLLGLSLIVLIIQCVFSVATHSVAPSKKTIKAEAPEPIQSEDEAYGFDPGQSSPTRPSDRLQPLHADRERHPSRHRAHFHPHRLLCRRSSRQGHCYQVCQACLSSDI